MKTYVLQYVQACPYRLPYQWRDSGTGDYIAALPNKEKAIAYMGYHKGDGNKWVVPELWKASRETQTGKAG